MSHIAQLLRDTVASNSRASSEGQLAKAFLQPTSATTGLQTYDLEAPAKLLYPVLTPLRNMIPRVSGKGGIQANWKAITGVNVTNLSPGLGEGNRGGVIAQTIQEYFAAYRGIGLDNYVTYEADFASEGFQDIKATAVQSLLRSLMIAEEAVILAGNGTTALGVTPTPTVALINTGGSIGTGLTVNVGCVALTLQGLRASSLTGGIPGQVSRTNADGSVDVYGGGSAGPSALASVTTTTATSIVTASVAPVVGAYGYAWFVGTGTSIYLAAITYINSAVFTSLPVTGQLFGSLSGDNSVNGLVFNGLMSIAAAPGSGAYYSAMPTGTAGVGSPLTPDGAGGIKEIDAVLQSFWDNYRLSPSCIWVSSQEQNYFRKKVLNAGNASNAGLSRFTISTSNDKLVGGTAVRGYTNPFGMGDAQELPIKHHPNLPPGTILFTTDTLPYALNGVTNLMQIRARRDYYQIEWPLRTRRYEYGVYADEVLQHYFPPSLGILTNIAPG